MADEPESIAEVTPAPEPASEPEVEKEQPVDLNAIEDEEIPEAEDTGEQQQLADDLEEFEWDGKKIQGPKGLKDGVLRHADYTRKTQEAAEFKRTLEAEKAAVAQQAATNEEELDIRATLKSVKTELDRYKDVDWDAWENEAPLDAQRGFRHMQQLKEAVGVAETELDTRQQARTQTAQHDTAKRLEETRTFAEKNIKGWTPEVDAKVTEFAMKELGFDRATLLGAYTPQVYRALYLAHLGHQLLNKPASAAKPAPTPSVPLTVVASKANPPARKDILDPDLSMEDYVAMRQKQNAAKRG